LDCHKNRFGQCSFTTFAFGSKGYVFEAVAVDNNPERRSATKKTSKRNQILNVLDSEKTAAQIASESGVNGTYLTNLLREVVNEGVVIKNGKGASALYAKK
jgi:hypothetical protein